MRRLEPSAQGVPDGTEKRRIPSWNCRSSPRSAAPSRSCATARIMGEGAGSSRLRASAAVSPARIYAALRMGIAASGGIAADNRLQRFLVAGGRPSERPTRRRDGILQSWRTRHPSHVVLLHARRSDERLARRRNCAPDRRSSTTISRPRGHVRDWSQRAWDVPVFRVRCGVRKITHPSCKTPKQENNRKPLSRHGRT